VLGSVKTSNILFFLCQIERKPNIDKQIALLKRNEIDIISNEIKKLKKQKMKKHLPLNHNFANYALLWSYVPTLIVFVY
jgi:hypothetical protein